MWEEEGRLGLWPLGGRSDAGLCLSPQQEVQNIFKAKHPMDTEITKAKVTALLAVLPGWPCVHPQPRCPSFLFPLHRSLGLVPRSWKRSIRILPILWEPGSSTPEPRRSGACCAWSRTSRPRSAS